jgi:hypothetical protein
MVDKITPIDKPRKPFNHLKKNKHDQRKKDKPKFTPPPDDAS